jgi:cytoskeleton protein RodZ
MISDEELVADNTNALLGVGDRLKAEREARGLTLDDVSQALKISRRVLDQVEANAWGQLPGHTFARGIVRGYAKFVHLDAEPLLLELEKAPLPKPPLLELPQSTRTALPVPGQSQTRDRLAMFAGVVLVAIAVLAYFLVPEDWLSGSSETAVTAAVGVAAPATPPPDALVVPVAPPALDSPPGSVAPLPANAGTPPATLPATAAAPPAGAVTTPAPALIGAAPPLPVAAAAPTTVARSALVLRFDQISWVEVRDRHGVMLLSENVAAGSERVVNGDAPIALALGNAEGVRVTFRGKVVDLKPHTRQKVARLSLE